MQNLAYRAGVIDFTARLLRTDGAIILMYHSVANQKQAAHIDPRNHVPPDIFEAQINYLLQNRTVVSLPDLLCCMQQGNPLNRKAVVITFDDGYLDNLTIAAPILERHGLPATLFLPTGYIDRGETQWVDQVYTAFKFRGRNTLIWGAGPVNEYHLDITDQYSTGYMAVCSSLLIASPSRRRMLLTNLYRQLHPSTTPPRLTMTWEDVRNLVTHYNCFEIGAHSCEHTAMPTLDCQNAQQELQACTRRIEEKLGNRPRYFSSPYGRSTQEVRQLVAKAGFEASFGGTTTGPIINKSTDPYALPRVEAPCTMANFDLVTCSANTAFWRRLGR